MALLPGQISGRTPDDFYLLNKNTACLGKEGCKSETSKGCRLPRELRPVACGLFPIVLANGRLYLYKTCPAVVFNTLDELAMLAEKAAGWLANFPLDELRHISKSLLPTILTLALKFFRFLQKNKFEIDAAINKRALNAPFCLSATRRIRQHQAAVICLFSTLKQAAPGETSASISATCGWQVK